MAFLAISKSLSAVNQLFWYIPSGLEGLFDLFDFPLSSIGRLRSHIQLLAVWQHQFL
jgi:hypothetical protein